MKLCLKNIKNKNVRIVFWIFLYVIPFFFILGQEVSLPSESQSVSPIKEEKKPATEVTAVEEVTSAKPKRVQTKPPAVAPKTQAPTVKQNVRSTKKIDPRIHWQFENAPEDKIFLYEPSFIPKLNIKDDFLSPYLEKEIIVERLPSSEEEIQKYKPNLLHIVIVVFALIAFIVYRWNIASRKKNYKIFKIKK